MVSSKGAPGGRQGVENRSDVRFYELPNQERTGGNPPNTDLHQVCSALALRCLIPAMQLWGLELRACLCGIASEGTGLFALNYGNVTAGTIRLGVRATPDYALRRRRLAMRAVSTARRCSTSV